VSPAGLLRSFSANEVGGGVRNDNATVRAFKRELRRYRGLKSDPGEASEEEGCSHSNVSDFGAAFRGGSAAAEEASAAGFDREDGGEASGAREQRKPAHAAGGVTWL
jgi:hypothetical protein